MGCAMEKPYVHTRKETYCDVCAKKVPNPVMYQFEDTYHLWFFCSIEHQYVFGKRRPNGYVELQ